MLITFNTIMEFRQKEYAEILPDAPWISLVLTSKIETPSYLALEWDGLSERILNWAINPFKQPSWICAWAMGI